MYVREGEANLLDDLIQLFPGKSETYYSIVDTKEQIVVEDVVEHEFLSIFMRLESTAETYDRRVYSFGDLLAQVGGIYQSVFFVGVIFIGIFSERLFISSILRKIYQLDTIRENQIKKNKNVNQNKDKNEYVDQEHPEPRSSQSVHLSDIKMENEDEIDPNEADMVKKSLSHTINLVDGKEKGSAKDEDRKRRIFESLKFILFNRELFKYSFKDITEYILWCVWCRKSKNYRKNPKYRKHAYYKAGEDKLQRELDVMSIIKAIRSLKLINKVLFTKEQRLLLKFQENDVIASTSEDSDMGNHNHNIVYEMHNRSEKIRNRFKENFESILDNYQTK